MKIDVAAKLIETIDEVLDEWAATRKNCAELEAALADAKTEYLNADA